MNLFSPFAMTVWLIIAAAAGVLLVLSIYQIKARVFWYDEAVSVTLVKLPFDQFLGTVAGVDHGMNAEILGTVPFGQDHAGV